MSRSDWWRYLSFKWFLHQHDTLIRYLSSWITSVYFIHWKTFRKLDHDLDAYSVRSLSVTPQTAYSSYNMRGNINYLNALQLYFGGNYINMTYKYQTVLKNGLSISQQPVTSCDEMTKCVFVWSFNVQQVKETTWSLTFKILLLMICSSHTSLLSILQTLHQFSDWSTLFQ